jgi:uncharacterized membrane protein
MSSLPFTRPVADGRRLVSEGWIARKRQGGRLSGTPVTLIRRADVGDRRGWPGDDDLRLLSALGAGGEGDRLALSGCEVEVARSQLPALGPADLVYLVRRLGSECHADGSYSSRTKATLKSSEKVPCTAWRFLMPIADSVVVVGFYENAKAYEGFSKLKSLSDQQQLTARSAAVVERDQNGALQIKDSFEAETGVATAGGGLVGMLLGAIAGPYGMLLGLTGGALAGGSFELDRGDEQDEVLTQLNAAINPGHTVLVAEVNEPTVEVLDKAMGDLGGAVIRKPEADVLTELEAADDAAHAAQAAARKAVREKKMAETKEKREDRIAALKAKFSRHHEAPSQARDPSASSS